MAKMTVIEQNKKILMISGALALIFIVLVVFAYLPLRGKAVELKASLERAEADVCDINKLLGKGRRLEEVINSLKSKLAEIERKFPEKEEVIFRELSEHASRMGIETGAMRPHNKNVVTEIGGMPVGSEDYIIQEMPISISLKAGYKKLGEFFKVLDEDFPVFVRIDTVSMQRSGDKSSGTLEAGLELNTYLVSPKVK